MDCPVKNLLGLRNKLLIAGALCMLQQEPDALDIMAGIDNAAVGKLRAGFAIGANIFQNALEFGVIAVAEDFIHTLLCPLLVKGLSFRIGTHHDACDIQIYHRQTKGTAGARLRNGLGAEAGGIGCTVPEIPVDLVGTLCPFQAFLLSRHTVILRIGHRIKGLGIVIAALAKRLSVCSDGEIHSALRIRIDAVFFHKVQAGFGCLQPLVPFAVDGAKISKNPAASSLHPHAFVGGIDLAFPVETGVDAAVLFVHAVLQPEMDAGVQLLANPRTGGKQFFFLFLFHKIYLR